MFRFKDLGTQKDLFGHRKCQSSNKILLGILTLLELEKKIEK